MLRIYVAGALTPKGSRTDCSNPAIEYLLNVRDMVKVSVELAHKGHAPFCPALDFQYFLSNTDAPFTEAEIKGMSLHWVDVCDGIFMLPGWNNSPGSVAELMRARKFGLDEYYSLSEVPDGRT